MPTSLFELHQPLHPWGDYGAILFHGMSCHLPRRDDRIQLERTGPFIPPISFPGFSDVVWTDQARLAFIAKGFTGAEFRPVRKARIVRFHWETWDRNADAPLEYPEEGEPEGYILDRPHDPALARSIGELWEFVPTPVRRLRMRGGRIVPARHPGLDVCVASQYGSSVILSRRMKDWLKKHYRDWVRCSEVRA